MYTVWHNVCENNYSNIVVCTNNHSQIVVHENYCSHIVRKTQGLNSYFCTQCLQSTEPWQVCPPDEFGKLALGASQAIFEG